MSAGTASINIGEVVPRAWRALMSNAVVMIVGFLIIAILLAVTGVILSMFKLGPVAQLVLGGPLLLGYYGAALRAARSESPQFGHVFGGFQRFVPALIANLVISAFNIVALVVGFISPTLASLCALPGLVLAFIFCTTYFFMDDQKLEPLPALQASMKRVMDNLVQWIVLFLAIIGFNIVGVLACGVGVLISAPLSIIMLAVAYDDTRG
ncbi:MAG: hypothetical protein K1Y02_04005 [Candidatus Hydrogenedentes bacterium]|nr:hypothetical protein [Candidatus Hydrogenedentota bacterium]